MEMHGKWNNKEERDNDPGYQHMKKKLAAKKKSIGTQQHEHELREGKKIAREERMHKPEGPYIRAKRMK